MIFKKENLGHQLYFIATFEELCKNIGFQKVNQVYTKTIEGKEQSKDMMFFVDIHIPYDVRDRLFNEKRCIDNVLVTFNQQYTRANLYSSHPIAEYEIDLFEKSMDEIMFEINVALSNIEKLEKSTKKVKCSKCSKDMYSFKDLTEFICRECK